MEQETELKLCPFCGCNVKIKEDLASLLGYSISCPRCGCTIKRAEKEDLIKAWNMRTNWSLQIPDKNRVLNELKYLQKVCSELREELDDIDPVIVRTLENMGGYEE